MQLLEDESSSKKFDFTKKHKITFLDLVIENNKTVSNCYRKPMKSGRFLNFALHQLIYCEIAVFFRLDWMIER